MQINLASAVGRWHYFYLRLLCRSHAGTVVLEWFKGDNASQWKSGKFDPRSFRNPWTDRHQNLHGWLRRGPLPLCNISSRYDYPLRLPNMRKCASSDSASFLVLPSAYSQDTCTDFHDQYVKWRGFAQGCAFWGSRKQNFTFRPRFLPKTRIFRQFSTGLPRQKGLTMGMLTCKLPLIVIVAQWKLYSE